MNESILPTAEEIRDGAARLGIKLYHGIWYDRDSACGCAAGVAAILREPTLAMRHELRLNDLVAELGAATVCGLSDGFEGARYGVAPNLDDEDYDAAYTVGRAVREAEDCPDAE